MQLDPDFVLIARTDARGAHGGSLDEAITRANLFLEAGADLAFVEGRPRRRRSRVVCRPVKGPIFYNQTGISPRLSARRRWPRSASRIAILPVRRCARPSCACTTWPWR